MNAKFISPTFFIFLSLNLFFCPQAIANHWTLQSSIAQAMNNSPELQQSTALIGARKAQRQLSEMWPDPSIEFKVDNQVGLDTGTGNYALSEISISQDIPLSRMTYQSRVANAQLNSAVHAQSQEALLLQNKVARTFYQLQLASEISALAQQRIDLADKLHASTNKKQRDPMIRYLTPLEKMRLDILREKSYQRAAAANGKRHEILIEFYKILGLDISQQTSVPPLLSVKKIDSLSQLKQLQSNHPLLASQRENLQAASDEIKLARSSSMRDPSISINRLRENFSTGTESVYGIMLNIEIPIHNRKNSAVSKAKYGARLQRIELARIKRDLELNLSRSHTHLNHVIEQANQYKDKVLEPAKKILQLSEKGFISGELNVLSLVDANNTYFESHIQYLNLLYQAWIEVCEINLNAGKFISLSENTPHKLSYNLTGGQ